MSAVLKLRVKNKEIIIYIKLFFLLIPVFLKFQNKLPSCLHIYSSEGAACAHWTVAVKGAGPLAPVHLTWLPVGSECSGSAAAQPPTRTAGSPPPLRRSRRPRSAAENPASPDLRRRRKINK